MTNVPYDKRTISKSHVYDKCAYDKHTNDLYTGPYASYKAFFDLSGKNHFSSSEVEISFFYT